MKKRILSLFLALVMLFSCLSLNVFATEGAEAQTEIAAGTVISDTLDAHTAAEIRAFIASQITSDYYSYIDGTSSITNNSAGALKSVGGRYVLSAPTNDNLQTYMQASNHATVTTNSNFSYSGRDWMPYFSSIPETRHEFVVQMDFEFTEIALQLPDTKSNTLNLIQTAFYSSITGNSNTSNNNQLGTLMPNLVIFRVEGGKGYLYASTVVSVNNKKEVGNYERVMELVPGTKYTIAVEVDTTYVNTLTDTYGRYNLYVNGKCVKENIRLLNSDANALASFNPANPYFVDANYNNLVLKKASDSATSIPAYFFADSLAELDFVTDANGNEIPDIYDNVNGITKELAAIINPVAVGKNEGIKDAPLGFVRWCQSNSIKFSGEAVYYDNLLVYYADSYKGTLVDHAVEDTHTHDFTKTTTNVTYSCEICNGKKVVAEAIDANGDRVCDVCVGALPTGGAVYAEDLKNEDVAIRIAANFNDGTKGGFTFGDDGDKVYKFGETQDGNKYVYSVPGLTQTLDSNKNVVKDENGNDVMRATTSYLQYQQLSDPRVETVKKFGELAGESYVISTDIRVNPDNLSTSDSLIQVLCYLNSTDNCTAIASAVFFAPVRLNGSGELEYRDGGTLKGTGIYLNDGEWRNIAVHHTPRGDASSPENTYDLYVNGKCIKENVKAISDNDNRQMTWSTNNLGTAYGTSSFACGGAKDFVVAFVRMAQHTPKLKDGSTATECIALDNGAVYYSDVYVGCEHNFVLEHTHDIEKNINKVVYTCDNCSLKVIKEVPMSLVDYSAHNYSGETPNINEVEKLLTDGYFATDFTSGKNNILSGNKGSLLTGDDAANIIKYVDGYAQYQEAPTSTGAYLQYWFDKGGNSTRFTYIHDNFEELRGDSYTVSVDFRIESFAAFPKDIYLMQMLSYAAFTDTPNDTLSNFSGVWFNPIKLEKSGSLLCVANSDAAYGRISIKENEWYTVTVHHTPRGDKYSPENTFDVFVNGKCVFENVPAFKAADSAKFAWETASHKSLGAKDYVPTTIRFCQIAPNGTAISLDNIYVYKNQDVINCLHQFSNTNVCEWCGYELEIEEHYCDICMGTAISDEVAITGRSATLGELVDMNFYVAVNGALAKDENAVATVSCGNKSETIALSSAKIDGGYKFSLPLRSTQMASDVKIEIDGATYTTSIEDYALDLIEVCEEAAPVAKALLNYGAAAQTYFAVKNNDAALADVLANAKLSEADKTVSTLAADELNDYAFEQEGATADVHFTGAKLQLASKTHMLLYFTAPEGATVTVNGVKAYAVKDDGEYYISFTAETPINAMTDEITVAVTYGTTTATTTVNVFTAVAAGIQDGSNANLVHLLNAYAQYCKAAAKFAAN